MSEGSEDLRADMTWLLDVLELFGG